MARVARQPDPRLGCARLVYLALLAWVSLVGLPRPAAAQGTEQPRPESIQVPDEAELEAAGAVIGKIYFDLQDIFDERDPRENRALFRLANELHVNTRESTVQAQLLFGTGDRFSARVIRETERNLRARDYLFDARIRPIAWDGERVDLLVSTRDVWSLKPGFSYQRKGGVQSSHIEIEEENLFGYGKNLVISRGRDVERRSLLVRWRDPNVWGSRWQTGLAYSSNDDGHARFAEVERPFYSFDTRWSAGVTLLDDSRVEPRYDAGEILDEFRRDVDVTEVRGGWSRGLVGDWTQRWLAGMRYDRRRFSLEPGRIAPQELPTGRTLSYPWIGVEWVEEDFEETRNLNQIGRTEDLYYGTSLRLELGWSSESLGSTRDSAILAAVVGTSLQFGEQQSLFLVGRASGRIESGELANGVLGGTARYYWRWHPKRVFFAGLETTSTEELNAETQLFMGGETDLRGYPFRFQSGTRRMQLTLEQRFYTDWYPFRLFNVGGAIFFDTGRMWGRSIAGTEPLGLLRNLGVGLRLGNSRSGFGSVIHIDVAVPLDRTAGIDGVQFVVDTKRSF